jgi:hypothetical protein
MTRVVVHQFRRYNPATDRVIISAYKMTADSIAAIGAEIIADTADEVRETALDNEGRYYPNG